MLAVMAEMKDLTAQDILAVQDIKVVPVDVPEWGGRVYVRSMSGTTRERYVESIREIKGKGKKQEIKILLIESGAKLAQQTMCDKDGNLLFTPQQVRELGEKSSAALQRVIDKAAELNGLSDDAEEDAKND
jgi:hypothetical protein